MIICWIAFYFAKYIPDRFHWMIVSTLIVLMVIIAATKPSTSSDYIHYYHMFVDFDNPKTELTTEPTYILLSRFLHEIRGSFEALLFIYALISIPLKIYSFKKLSSFEILYLALPVYFSFFYQLHDCEQIRLAAAMAFIMYAYVCRVEQRHWITWISLCLVATLFHYTTIVAIAPLLLYRNKDFSTIFKVFLSCIVLSGVLIWVLKINLIGILPIPAIEAKMALYELSISKGDQIEGILLYHPMALLRYATFFYSLYFYDTLRKHVKGLNIILIAEAFGLFAWGGLSGTAVFAVRISELYQIPEIILFASIFYTIKPQWVGKIYPIAVAIYFFMYGIRINQFGFIS